MNIKTLEYKRINEVMHVYEHSSGLKAFVIPKKGYSKKYATFATYYGSINNEFIIPGETNVTRVPDGIAHFLEHKLFEQKDGSVMDKFAELGSSPNAYTGFGQTVYLFSCTDKFKENFKLLLDFVQNPYITDESIEKEKGIIGQEIRMYQDDPNWRGYFNFLNALYKNNPVRIDIAGTIESISEIDRDTLYKCYNTFYHPSNMIIHVVGDVDYMEVFEQVEAGIIKTDPKQEIKRIFPDEPNSINKDYIEQKLPVSIPLFLMGYKDNNAVFKGKECIMRETAMKIILQVLMGRSSDIYNDLYNKGLINRTFESDYNIGENYAFSMFGGESNDPEAVKQFLMEAIRKALDKGLDKDSCKRIKQSMMGKFIKRFNSVERISHAFISVYFKDVLIFDYIDIFDKISYDYINNIFNEHFREENLVMSVI